VGIVYLFLEECCQRLGDFTSQCANNSWCFDVLPDAPIGVVTGLQVPTIAVVIEQCCSHQARRNSSTASLANAGALILTPTLVGTYRGGTSIFYFIVSPIDTL
jgi:hypothetical protein